MQRSAHIVTQYYGRFPARLVFLDLGIMDGAGIGGGHTINEGGLSIHVNVGRDATPEGLANDWVLVHEMVHLALPEIGRRHDWLAEGLAVYVEGVARAQAGNRAIPDVWAEGRRSMPLGLPREGEGGMDQTPTWARKYWGGALFCLEADVQIRQHTGNRLGLQAALRAILDATGGYAAERDIGDVLRIGDAATGTRVLEDLYERERTTPVVIDLDALWRALGVPKDPLSEPFDDHAPLAAIRIAITRPQGYDFQSMCLILLAWRVHPEFPCVLAANRDEFHDRATAIADWWPGEAGILAGRDLHAGGTWLGVTRRGHFAALTNFRDGGARRPDAPSRGTLVSELLESGRSVSESLSYLRRWARSTTPSISCSATETPRHLRKCARRGARARPRRVRAIQSSARYALAQGARTPSPPSPQRSPTRATQTTILHLLRDDRPASDGDLP